jgi:diaminopimelate epimerase
MSSLPFIKMHGLGNDFVVLDLRARAERITPTQARAIAERHSGVGCDQVISIEPSDNPDADAFMRIHNHDGGEVEACGNGTRCVASLLFAERGSDSVVIETLAGLLPARAAANGRVTVDMGRARLNWDEIPLAHEMDTLHVNLTAGPASAPVVSDPCCVGMGNPHAVFFVEDINGIDIPTIGSILETHPIFPERANIGFAQIRNRDNIRLRVWERGAGLTLACGSGACAAMVAAARRDLTERAARIEVDGGMLDMVWREDGHVEMTGPVATSFTGLLGDELLAPAVMAAD